MGAVLERDLGTGDVADPERAQRLGHLHGAVQAVVIGERQRLVALLGGRPRELDGVRRAVEERVGGVAMELHVGHEHMFAWCMDGRARPGGAILTPDEKVRPAPGRARDRRRLRRR